ncbi:MAG: UvrB/UvrC motif-containing protein [Pseudomonadota bacterium]
MKDIERLEKQMYLHAQNLEFEEAIKLRNRVKRLEEQLKK